MRTPLGIVPNKIVIGATINLSPKMKVKGQLWGLMTPDQQMDFFKVYIEEVYVPCCSYLEAYPEHCKSGMIHMHLILYIDDSVDYLKYHLQNVRSRVAQHSMAIRLSKGNYNSFIRMNYIHEVRALEWDNYCRKDLKFMKLKPLFFKINAQLIFKK